MVNIPDKNLVEELEKYVKSEEKETVVDWASINKISSSRRGSYNESLYDKVLKHLIDIKILSHRSNHNYELVGCGLSLNPTISICPLYFTRENDAKEYKKANFSGAMYPVNIRRIQNVD